MESAFRDKSALMQFLLLMSLCAAGMLFSLVIGVATAALIYGVDGSTVEALMQDPTSPEAMEIAKYLQGWFSIGLFLLPALIGARLLSKNASAYLGIERFPKPGLLVIGLVGLLALSAVGVSDLLYQLAKGIPMPTDWQVYFEQQEETAQSQYEVFLEMPNTFAFVKSFILIALLPAVCEETLFRGVLQPIFKKGFGNAHIAIWLTAFCFSIIHFNFYALLSIWVLGATLGYLREWTGSLWVSILMHMLNNGIIVCAVYFGEVPLEQLNEVSIQEENSWLGAGSVLAFVLVLYLIRRAFLAKAYDQTDNFQI